MMVGTAGPKPATTFVQAIDASVGYWREMTDALDDVGLGRLDQERHNLHRAVHFGLALPQTWRATVEVVLQTIPLAEQRVYWQEWVALLESLLAECPTDNLKLRYRILIELGRFHNNSQHFEKALAFLHEAERIAQEMGDPADLAKALYNLGRSHYEMRDYEQACHYAQAVQVTLEPAGGSEIWLIAEAEKILGHAARSRGELEASLSHMNRAVELWRPLGKRTELARAIIDLGVSLYRAGDDEAALARWEEAAAMLQPTGNMLDLTLIKINMVAIYNSRQDWAAAERLLHEADSRWLRQSGHQKYQALIATSMAAVLLEQARWEEAERFARRGVVLWEELDDILSLANATGAVGEALAGQGEVVAAREQFERALEMVAGYQEQAFAQRLRESFFKELAKLPTSLERSA